MVVFRPCPVGSRVGGRVIVHYESMVLLGWLGTPGLAYLGGRWAIARVSRGAGSREAFSPWHRIDELRRRQASGQRAIRGRMSEAVRLAEEAARGPIVAHEDGWRPWVGHGASESPPGP